VFNRIRGPWYFPTQLYQGWILAFRFINQVYLTPLIRKYSLQVEFLEFEDGEVPEVNVRFNKGHSDFTILKADGEILIDGELDLNALPAT
jgi:hypothetical protein